MDESDIKIVMLLNINSRLSYRKLADYLDLSLNAAYKRVQNLIDLGVIQRFLAKINPYAIGAIYVYTFGKSDTHNIDKTILDLEQNENISQIVLTSRNYIYIGAFLRSYHELGEYSSFISNTAEIQSPIIGLRDGSYHSLPIDHVYPKTKVLNIDKLDLSIIRSLHKDSRKPISEIADDLGSTPSTIRRRLSRLITNGVIELTTNLHPEASGDIFSILIINLRSSIDRIEFAKLINSKYQPFIMFCYTFSNLPNTLLFWVWTKTIKQLNILLDDIQKEEVESVITDIIRKGMFLDTWKEDLLYKEEISI
ncbi:MAG: AsnC family transcriptional regulator [Promethearchaeota archaeon]